MIDFLVQLSTTLPADWPPERRVELLDREAARGRELRDQGTITAMWRLPGRLANVGVWRAESPSALHAAITSLPAWPWMTVEVAVLSRHSLFP